MKDLKYFRNLIIESQKQTTPEYGGNVMLAIQQFKNLKNTDEIRAYQDAIESMLEDNDPKIRKYAVTLCLGFFVFRTALI